MARREDPPSRRQRLSDHRLELGVLLFVAVLVATAFWPQLVADFWREQPLLTSFVTGVASGVALLLIAALLIDRHLSARDLRQWRDVARVAYRGLQHENWWIKRRLMALVTGSSLHEHSARVDPTIAREARRYAAEVGGSLPDDWEGRLPHLLDSYDYVWFLQRQVGQLQEEIFEIIATWSPVMLTAHELRKDLAQLGALSDAIMELHREIWHGGALNLPPHRWAPVPEWKAAMRDRFEAVFSEIDALGGRFTDKSRLPWHVRSGGGVRQTEPRFAAQAEERSSSSDGT